VDVPQTLASILGIPASKTWMGIDVGINVQTTETRIDVIRTAITSIIINNTILLCPTCEEMYPVFQNIAVAHSVGTNSRRLRATTINYRAEYYIILVFQFQANTGNIDGLKLRQLLSVEGPAYGLQLQVTKVADSVLDDVVISNPHSTPVGSTPVGSTPVVSTPSGQVGVVIDIVNDRHHHDPNLVDDPTWYIVLIVLVVLVAVVSMLSFCCYENEYKPVPRAEVHRTTWYTGGF
jgi:Ca2+/H+ antiporter